MILFLGDKMNKIEFKKKDELDDDKVYLRTEKGWVSVDDIVDALNEFFEETK